MLARSMLVLATALMCAAAIPTAVSAASWRPLSDHRGDYTDEVGMVRGPDGTLHVVYLDERGSNDTGIKYRTLTAAGGLGDPIDVLGRWDTVTNPDVELVGGVPITVWSGLNNQDPKAGGELWSASLGPAGWTPGMIIDSAQTSYVDNASTALDANGTLWTVFSQGVYGMYSHAGMDPATVDTNYEQDSLCCTSSSNIARDAVTGAVTLINYSSATGLEGYWSREIAPTPGEAQLLPGIDPDESTHGHATRLAAAARTTGGIYSAYCDVPVNCTSIRVGAQQTAGLVYRFPRGVTDPSADTIWTAAAPGGRMWLSYAVKNAVYVTRSNRSLTAWGPTRKLTVPRGTTRVYNTSGDATLGPLDLFANLETGGNRYNINTIRVSTQLLVTPATKQLSSSAARVVKLRVTDAGDAVPGAKIRFRGVTRSASKTGFATFVIPRNTKPGTYPVTGIAKGFVNGTASVTVVRSGAIHRPGKH